MKYILDIFSKKITRNLKFIYETVNEDAILENLMTTKWIEQILFVSA
ncbi:hypothetical protein [Clostridium sp. BJN0013]